MLLSERETTARVVDARRKGRIQAKVARFGAPL